MLALFIFWCGITFVSWRCHWTPCLRRGQLILNALSNAKVHPALMKVENSFSFPPLSELFIEHPVEWQKRPARIEFHISVISKSTERDCHPGRRPRHLQMVNEAHKSWQRQENRALRRNMRKIIAASAWKLPVSCLLVAGGVPRMDDTGSEEL